MDDFYKECYEKIQNAADPVTAIDELMMISWHDLPMVQVCKFAEQATTLLSVIFQAGNSSPQNLTIKFRQIRQQLIATLNYMEQIMEMERKYPPSHQSDNCWW